MLCNGFCLSTVIPVLTNFCGPSGHATFSYPRVHTKARDFNFARCQRLLIMSKNTIPAFRVSWGDQYVPGRAWNFFAPCLSFVVLPTEPQGQHMALLYLLFLKKIENNKTPEYRMSFNSVKWAESTSLRQKIRMQNSSVLWLAACSCNNSLFSRLEEWSLSPTSRLI